jgi:hypothetical protein
MSSFFVSKATIDACVAAIHHNAAYHRDHGMLYATSMDTLGKELWELNRDAVCTRYNDVAAETDGYEAKIAAYKYKTTFPTLIQMLKSLQCLIYQCSEGNVPERETYKALERVADLIKDRIISDLPVYKAAKWDL